MFYCINPNYRYQFFSPSPFDRPDPFPGPIPTDDQPAEEPKHNLVNALAALYAAYGGEEELNNNAVDIIYKIADVIGGKGNAPEESPEGAAAESKS